MTGRGPSAAPPLASGRGPLLVVFVTVFLDLLGFGLIIPIQAFYAESFGARPAVITLLGASYSLMQFLFLPAWGRLSDRIGRRPVILSSVAVSCVGFALFGLAESLPWLFASRMLAGFGNANIGAAQAVIADTTSAEDRARGMGLIGAAFGLGFIIGPAVGGSLGQLGLHVPALAAAGLAAINWGLAYALLPETRQPGSPSHRGESHRKEVLRLPEIPRLLALSLVLTTGFALMEQVLGLFIEHTFVLPQNLPAEATHKRSAALTTWAMLAVGVTMAVVQGGLIGTLARRFGERRLVLLGALTITAGLALVPVTGHLGSFLWLLPNVVLLALGSGMTTPSLTSLLSRGVPHDRQGTALGLGQSMAALGRVLGPMMAGLLFELGPDRPFQVGAVLVAVAAALALGLREGR